MTRPHASFTVPELVPLVQQAYAHSEGCPLHILLDDANCEDHWFDGKGGFIERALADQCWNCYALALILRECSVSQRMKLYRLDDKARRPTGP